MPYKIFINFSVSPSILLIFADACITIKILYTNKFQNNYSILNIRISEESSVLSESAPYK